MSKGQSRSVRTNDLSFIFFKIRETRCPKTRRSWQRRARLALAQREDLTPSERHEIACAWSQRNAHQIDSPAMSKLHGKAHAPSREQTIKAASLYRRSFDVKKPAFSGLAANDEQFTERCNAARRGLFLENSPLDSVDHTLNHAAFEGVFSQGLYCGSVQLSPCSDSRERLFPRREPVQALKINRPISQLLEFSLKRLNL